MVCAWRALALPIEVLQPNSAASADSRTPDIKTTRNKPSPKSLQNDKRRNQIRGFGALQTGQLFLHNLKWPCNLGTLLARAASGSVQSESLVYLLWAKSSATAQLSPRDLTSGCG